MIKGKVLRVFFVVLITLSVTMNLAAGGRAESTNQPVRIAVAFWQIDANSILIQRYFQEYVGPALNVNFMFSEAIEDAASLITFMENAYAAGCQGIINYQNSSVEQALAKANELGMFIATQTPIEVENSNLPYNVGFVAASPESVAESFGDLVRDMVSVNENNGIVIVSAGAGFGNDEHYEATVAILRVLQDIYGLRYERPIETLAVSRAVTEATNNRGIKITIYPGFPTGDTYVTGMSTLLQTGEYDTILACNAAYARFLVAIDEVERAFRKNIRISAITAINDQTRTAFMTIDSTGNNTLDSAMLMPSISQAAGLFALVYNGITGHADRVRVNGRGVYFNAPKWKCHNAAEYLRIERINTSDTNWEVTIDELRQMLVAFNPNANAQSIYRQLESVTAENILRARGL